VNKRRERTSRFGQAVIKSFEEFLGAAERGEPITARRVKLDLDPTPYTAAHIKRLRRKLGVSQAVFSQLMAVSIKTVQSWESGASLAPPMACRLLDEISFDPKGWMRRQWARSVRRKSVAFRA
jgi:putative transcriptional regulator